MKYGLSDSEFRFLNENLILPLKKSKAKVFIFGSRAIGSHKQFSDVDIMVESENDLTKMMSQISEKFVESNFPYKLDLVSINYFAKSYLPQDEKQKIEL